MDRFSVFLFHPIPHRGRSMSHQTEHPTTLSPSTDQAIIPADKPRMTVREGFDLLRDLAAGTDGKHNTRDSRNTALDSLKKDFGMSECETQSLLMTVVSGDFKSVLASLQRRRMQKTHRQQKDPQVN